MNLNSGFYIQNKSEIKKWEKKKAETYISPKPKPYPLDLIFIKDQYIWHITENLPKEFLTFIRWPNKRASDLKYGFGKTKIKEEHFDAKKVLKPRKEMLDYNTLEFFSEEKTMLETLKLRIN